LGIRWTWLRRATQLGLLAVFLWLFRRTESTGAADLNAVVNVLFRLDPLVAVAAMVAGKQLLVLVWPALMTVILTLLLGRFFCGWVCPLGTLLDITSRLLPRRRRVAGARWRAVKFFLLGLVLVSAALGVQLLRNHPRRIDPPSEKAPASIAGRPKRIFCRYDPIVFGN